MRPNPIKRALQAGQTVVGSEISRLRSAEIPRLYAAAELDFVFIDMEHSSFSLETVSDMVQAARGANIVPLVRVPQAEYAHVSRVLDVGAQGIIVPRVNRARQVRQVLSWMYYPPRGRRGFACRPEQTDDHLIEPDAFMEAIHRNTLCVIQIERQEALDNLDEMLAIPGVDVACLGYMDLSVDLGIAAQLEHPRMVAAIERLIAVCEANGVTAGIICPHLEAVQHWMAAGMRFVSYSTEALLLQEAAAAAVRRLRPPPTSGRIKSEVSRDGHAPADTVEAGLVEKAVAGIFRACGVGPEEAGIVAAHLVDAEACGVLSHGLIRVPQYVTEVEQGRIRAGATLRVLSETSSTAVLDGQHGFGQVMAERAMKITVQRAEGSGVASVTLINCGHTGRLGSYTEQAARRGMVGLMMVNKGGHGQWVAPFGGGAARLSTNPLSLAVPTEAGEPLVLDIATSVVPEGKIRAALEAGRAIPEGWVIDSQGRATTNPADLYGWPRGALLPFGGHKGFGLAMLVEALAGGLSGAGCCIDAHASLEGQTDGVFLCAIKIDAFRPLAEFQRTISRLVQHVQSAPRAPGVTEILVPGEREAQNRRRHLREGIPLAPATSQMLRQLLERYGVASELRTLLASGGVRASGQN
jgi:uncharacterized oxidoreductase